MKAKIEIVLALKGSNEKTQLKFNKAVMLKSATPMKLKKEILMGTKNKNIISNFSHLGHRG